MRRVIGVILAAAMVFALTACSVLYEREYISQHPYEAEPAAGEGTAPAAPASSITNYSSLKQAILQLVAERAESAELQFQNYDGNITQDLSVACWEVKSSTALGAFAVDYISYDLSRIVSYYQAELHITYKRSADQIAAVESVYTMSALSEKLMAALRENKSYLVFEITVASATADTVRGMVEEAYYADPLVCPVMPGVDVGIFPESGVSRIMEITLGYDKDGETLSVMRAELMTAAEAMSLAAGPRDAASGEMSSQRETVYALCGYVTEHCVLDENAGSTAWDALVGGTADSEGLAMALMAGCRETDMACSVVRGRLDGVDHVWNIVTVDGQPYHVDLTAGDSAFLVGDDSLWGRYWWDTSLYPACPGSYAELSQTAFSPEPAG